MLIDASTLGSAVHLIADTLRHDYGVDPLPVFTQAGIALPATPAPGTRYPFARMQQLWSSCIAVTGDPTLPLAVGRRVTPASLHALGFSWLASGTLEEALQRFCRYHRVISTVGVVPRLRTVETEACLELHYPDHVQRLWPQGVEALFMAVVTLCRLVSTPAFRPLAVSFSHPAPGDPARYEAAFAAPVRFGAAIDALAFQTGALKEPLTGQNPDVARATDRVAEQYLESLDPNLLTYTLRRLLIPLLESGVVDQKAVAARLNRSASTLQRQLQAEGTSFRAVMDETRSALAEHYLREGQLSHAEIAYKLGFSDQSNFSRAFRRWRGMSPREFQRAKAS